MKSAPRSAYLALFLAAFGAALLIPLVAQLRFNVAEAFGQSLLLFAFAALFLRYKSVRAAYVCLLISVAVLIVGNLHS